MKVSKYGPMCAEDIMVRSTKPLIAGLNPHLSTGKITYVGVLPVSVHVRCERKLWGRVPHVNGQRSLCQKVKEG